MPQKKAPAKPKAPSKRASKNGPAATAVIKTKPAPKKRTPAPAVAVNGNGFSVTHEDIAYRAYLLWEYRGRPLGSPDEDWYRAQEQLGASSEAH